LPTVLLEAMALGTLCVSTDVTGITELVRDRQTGLIVPQHDAEQLAIALQQLLSNPALRVKLSTQVKQLIESEFDIHRNSAALRAIFYAAEPMTLKEFVIHN
jgi:colanic acid/amylovoran biosynthesis glycosyltransferase